MNIQTEHLEDHTARFTVEVGSDRLEKAKRNVARKLAKRYNIPGFRKGKAPYSVLVNYLGEGAILEDAVEELGNEVYRDALTQAEIMPYGPGELEDFSLDPNPTFKFIVPLQPEVDLGDYRDIRVPYEEPVIEDEAVEAQLEQIQEGRALIEDSEKPVREGNRITVDIKAVIVSEFDEEDEDEADETDEAEDDAEIVDSEETDADDEDQDDETEAEDEDADEHPIFLDREDMVLLLTEEREPAPGFTEAMLGATVGENRVFTLTYPDDAEEYLELAGQEVEFDVTVKRVQTVTLPELNDDFAARVTESEDEPLTLLQLRMRIRDNLKHQAEDEVESEYADEVLDKIIDGARVAYPEALITDQLEHMLEHLDRDLHQRGLTLKDYMRVTGKTREDLHVDYREDAIKTIQRTLVTQQLMVDEQLQVTEEQIDAEIDAAMAQFGDQAAAFRSVYDRPEMRENIARQLLNRAVYDRIIAIARGETIEAPAATDEAAEAVEPDEPEAEPAETSADETSQEGDTA